MSWLEMIITAFAELEGKAKLRLHLQRERNQTLIKKAKQEYIKHHPKMECQICAFSFEKTYGEIGKEYLEAHHIKPVSELEEDS